MSCLSSRAAYAVVNKFGTRDPILVCDAFLLFLAMMVLQRKDHSTLGDGGRLNFVGET